MKKRKFEKRYGSKEYNLSGRGRNISIQIYVNIQTQSEDERKG